MSKTGPIRKTETVLFKLTNRGLFSELNNLLNAYFFSIKKGLRFYVDTSESTLYFPNGFEQFFSIIGDSNPPENDFLPIRGGQSSFHKMRGFCKKNLSYLQKSKLATELKLNATTQDEVRARIQSLSLPKRFCAAHIRWGDKLVREASQYCASDYLSKLPTDCKDLFLMTDDYRSLKGFSNSNLRLHTFAKSNQTGHSTKKRIARPFTRSEVIQLLAEVEIASRSDVFVGTMSSNVSRFITLKHSSFNDCVSLDRSWHAL